jgi:hypothetical protein
VPARHGEIFPDCGQILLAHAQQIDALATGDLHGGNAVLVDDIGNAPQLGAVGHAAPHARHD